MDMVNHVEFTVLWNWFGMLTELADKTPICLAYNKLLQLFTIILRPMNEKISPSRQLKFSDWSRQRDQDNRDQRVKDSTSTTDN